MVGSCQGYVQCQAFALIFQPELSIHLLWLIRNLFVIYLDWTGSSSPEQQQHTSIYWLILTRPMHITLCTAIRNKKREQNPPNASIWRSSPPDTKDPKCFHLKVLSITSHSLPTPIKCIKIHCYLVIQIPLFQNLKPSVIIPKLLFHDHTVFQVTLDPFDSYQQVVGSFFWAARIWIAKTCWLSWAKMGVGRMRKVGYMDWQ